MLHTHNLSSHNLTSRLTLRGRPGTWRHGPSLCVAGVALGDMDPHFAWQAWRLWHWAGSGGALGSQVSPWAPRLFAWQAWHLVTWTFTLRESHTTCSHTSLCVAGTHTQLVLTQLDIDAHFAWQAWDLATCSSTLRGRRGAKLKCQKCHMSCTHMSRVQTAMIPDHINKASTKLAHFT